MIAIIDYKMGNLGSVRKALTHLHYDSVITSDPSVIAAASGVILPGVGAFGPAMENIRAAGLDNVIKGIAERGHRFSEYVWACSSCLIHLKRASL